MMSTSDAMPGLTMWWHADLPAAAADPGPTQPPEFAREDWAVATADGADLLEWILPTLSVDRSKPRDAYPDGGPRRSLRRQLRDEG